MDQERAGKQVALGSKGWGEGGREWGSRRPEPIGKLGSKRGRGGKNNNERKRQELKNKELGNTKLT